MQVLVYNNTQGFVVQYNGQPLQSSSLDDSVLSDSFPISNPTITLPANSLSGASATQIYLTVECGANATSANLTLVFSSTCDPSISVQEMLQVTCIQPCPTLSWATPTTASQPMLANAKSVGNPVGASFPSIILTLLTLAVTGQSGTHVA